MYLSLGILVTNSVDPLSQSIYLGNHSLNRFLHQYSSVEAPQRPKSISHKKNKIFHPV